MTLVQLFSFDVVGSAAYKSDCADEHNNPIWLKAFHEFFEKTPLIFTAEIARIFFDEDGEFPEVPVWKAIGDELVFITYPESSKALQLLTKAFASSMQLADQHFNSAWNLRVHGVTWSFEEGERNLAIRFRELENDQQRVMDLIGPDVDLGFRLVTHAPPGGVLITSCHLARMMPDTITITRIGEAALKGVPSSPYPLLQLEP